MKIVKKTFLCENIKINVQNCGYPFFIKYSIMIFFHLFNNGIVSGCFTVP